MSESESGALPETAHCVVCRAMKPVENATETRLKNGRRAVTGHCATCGTKVFRIVRQG